MDIRSIRDFVGEHPHGVLLVMADGTEHVVPHRDYLSFGPLRETGEARRGPHATAFVLWEKGTLRMRLVNALLVREVVPLNGQGRSRKRRAGGGSR